MKQRAFIYIILAGIGWGTSPIFAYLLRPYGFSSLQMTFIRSIVALCALLVYVLLKDKALLRTKPFEILLFAGIGITFFLTASCYFTAMQMTSASTAVILMYTAPILVVIYSVIFLGEKLTVFKAILVGTMIVGCGLVSGVAGGMELNLPGVGMGLLAGIAYASYNILTKLAMRRNNNPFTTTVYCFTVSTLIAFFVCQPNSLVENFGKLPIFTFPTAILLGVCTCFMPYILYTCAMKVLPAGVASSLGIIEPMAATIFSIFLGELPDVLSCFGIILILGSVFLLSRCEE